VGVAFLFIVGTVAIEVIISDKCDASFYSGLEKDIYDQNLKVQDLNNKFDNLIVMDEIGRGTSTYDGISIAWAVAEYLVTEKSVAAKTLFATHYHELQTLEEKYPERIKNYHAHTEQQDGKPIFLHTILPGGTSHSHGIAVAELAGVPRKVTKRAEELLSDLEKGRNYKYKTP
jgi:DNA mismatch repair protein MutS